MLKYLILNFFIFCSLHNAFAENNFQEFSSDYVKVVYKSNENLNEFNKKIVVKKNIILAYKSDAFAYGAQDELSLKLDAIFFKIEQILDMYPKNAKVIIYLCNTEQEFKDIYWEFYKKDFSNLRGETDVLCFYRYKDNTVYLYTEQLNVNILVHEMAHCIIDHYFSVMPPIKTQEILAMYVDAYFSKMGEA